MKNIFKTLLLSAVVLIAGAMVSCSDDNGTDSYEGMPTIEVEPTSLSISLEGGETEAVLVSTPAAWSIDVDTDGVIPSLTSGNGPAHVSFVVPEADAMRTIKVTFSATGYVYGYPITKKATLTIVQSDSEFPTGDFIYKEDCGTSVQKEGSYWPYVDAYQGWNPQGGEGVDQSGVTYTGSGASVRNSGKSWAPVGATYSTDAPYAYISKADNEFVINDVALKSGTLNYTLSFTAYNTYASLNDSPYTPAAVAPASGKNLSVSISTDNEAWAEIAFSVVADGTNGWYYAIAPFTLASEVEKIYIKFHNYKADTSTALPSDAYKYQGSMRLDDFTLTIGGNGPVLDFTIPETPVLTISDVLAQGEGTYKVENARIYATYARGALLTDASGKMILAYLGEGVNIPAVGSVVTVEGSTSTYAGLLQFGQGTTLTATGETVNVDYGTAVVMSGSDADAYLSAPEIKYATISGSLNISGYYYNIEIDGATTARGSISYPDTEMAAKLVDMNGAPIKATGFLIGANSNQNGNFVNMMITDVVKEGEANLPDQPTGTFTKVSTVAALTAGEYYMAAYITEYDGNDYSAYPYHVWTGEVSGDANADANADLVTIDYKYAEGKLVVEPADAIAVAAKVAFEAVAEKANTYYIKVGDKYLASVVAAKNRRLALDTTAAEWVATDNANGGITLSSNGAYLGSANASYNFLRSYYKEATLKQGVVLFTPGEPSGDEPVTPDPTPDPEPTPDPTPDPTPEPTGTYVSLSLDTIDTSSWTVNNYGSQDVTNLSTYLTFNVGGFDFTACKWCLPDAKKAYNGIAMQAQGNTDATKQSRIGNTTSFGKIRKITVITYNEKYSPNFNIIADASQIVGVDVPASMTNAESLQTTETTVGSLKKFTTVFTPSSDCGFFAIYKNTQGALYTGEIIIEYDK